MSYPTDLLPFGEVFAELDLVVRQLDDGSLTVTEDDSLPDGERVRVTSEERGLKASLAVVAAPSSSDALLTALERISQKAPAVDFVWRDGQVWSESVLPWDMFQHPLISTFVIGSQGMDTRGGRIGNTFCHGGRSKTCPMLCFYTFQHSRRICQAKFVESQHFLISLSMIQTGTLLLSTVHLTT